jgi:hypothetical protein
MRATSTSARHGVRLARPGPIRLAIRVVLGAASVQGLVSLLTNWHLFRARNPIQAGFWLVTLVTVWLLPEVFGIALRRRWGAWPLVVFLAGAAATGLGGYLAWGELWNTALAAWVYVADLLVFTALAVSFPLAVITRTPGCELNAIPRLLANRQGEVDVQRACSVGLHRLDRWEATRTAERLKPGG